MKNFTSNYVKKVEDRYVFNISLFFWHFFIFLSSVAVGVSLLVLLWTIVPVWQRKVVKEPYPTKQEYPAPVQVSISELNLNEQVKDVLPETKPKIEEVSKTTAPLEDSRGKGEYEASLNILEQLIPPAKYSWSGSGYWTYPYGEVYWIHYQQERFRTWVSTAPGVKDILSNAYSNSNSKNYMEKKSLLDAYNNSLKLIKEENRLAVLKMFTSHVSNNVDDNMQTISALQKLIVKVPQNSGFVYLSQLLEFAENNTDEKMAMIQYIDSIIERFAENNRAQAIMGLVLGYYGFFNGNYEKQKEATDLYISLLPNINTEKQIVSLNKYYRVFIEKNRKRDQLIDQIEQEYQSKVSSIDAAYILENEKAELNKIEKKARKAELRAKSVIGISGGILIIVLIGTILVFLSIQRSVKRIEDKIIQ